MLYSVYGELPARTQPKWCTTATLVDPSRSSVALPGITVIDRFANNSIDYSAVGGNAIAIDWDACNLGDRDTTAELDFDRADIIVAGDWDYFISDGSASFVGVDLDQKLSPNRKIGVLSAFGLVLSAIGLVL